MFGLNKDIWNMYIPKRLAYYGQSLTREDTIDLLTSDLRGAVLTSKKKAQMICIEPYCVMNMEGWM